MLQNAVNSSSEHAIIYSTSKPQDEDFLLFAMLSIRLLSHIFCKDRRTAHSRREWQRFLSTSETSENAGIRLLAAPSQ